MRWIRGNAVGSGHRKSSAAYGALSHLQGQSGDVRLWAQGPYMRAVGHGHSPPSASGSHLSINLHLLITTPLPPPITTSMPCPPPEPAQGPLLDLPLYPSQGRLGYGSG